MQNIFHPCKFAIDHKMSCHFVCSAQSKSWLKSNNRNLSSSLSFFLSRSLPRGDSQIALQLERMLQFVLKIAVIRQYIYRFCIIIQCIESNANEIVFFFFKNLLNFRCFPMCYHLFRFIWNWNRKWANFIGTTCIGHCSIFSAILIYSWHKHIHSSNQLCLWDEFQRYRDTIEILIGNSIVMAMLYEVPVEINWLAVQI